MAARAGDVLSGVQLGNERLLNFTLDVGRRVMIGLSGIFGRDTDGRGAP